MSECSIVAFHYVLQEKLSCVEILHDTKSCTPIFFFIVVVVVALIFVFCLETV